MNATVKAEILRLLDEYAGYLPRGFDDALRSLRSLLAAQEEVEPSADHWLQAAQECPDIASEWIEQRARELARQGMGKP